MSSSHEAASWVELATGIAVMGIIAFLWLF